jgi:hypothetical protein
MSKRADHSVENPSPCGDVYRRLVAFVTRAFCRCCRVYLYLVGRGSMKENVWVNITLRSWLAVGSSSFTMMGAGRRLIGGALNCRRGTLELHRYPDDFVRACGQPNFCTGMA